MSIPDLNSGALALVADEHTSKLQVISGEIPPELNGTLVRNGPNPLTVQFIGQDVLNWWPEAAMLHAVSFNDGSVTSYRNRWVRTQNWANHTGADETFVDTNPNVNVVNHAGLTLALAEGGIPLVTNEQLETLGESTAHPSFAKGLTAHPKIDSQTGELMAFGADWNEPWLRYVVLDANGTETLDMTVEVPAPAMMHDMAITARYSILMDLNVAYDFSMMAQGYRIPIHWHDERQSRLCITPRHGGEVRWVDIAPCFIQHVVNAHDTADGGIELELPRINESYIGRAHRYSYCVVQPSAEEMRGIVQHDAITGATVHHEVAPPDQNSEPVFVAKPGATKEDDGWLLVCVYRTDTDSSEIQILEAADISCPPVAVVALQRRILAGFHGAWIDGR